MSAWMAVPTAAVMVLCSIDGCVCPLLSGHNSHDTAVAAAAAAVAGSIA
jgi:hypothetical protein